MKSVDESETILPYYRSVIRILLEIKLNKIQTFRNVIRILELTCRNIIRN